MATAKSPFRRQMAAVKSEDAYMYLFIFNLKKSKHLWSAFCDTTQLGGA
jgi:hypothetical protein